MEKTLFQFKNASDETGHSDEKPLKVFVVDDDENVLKTTKSALDNYTYKGRKIELSFFRNAAGTIEALKDDSPTSPEIAVVLLDIVMEDMGYDVIKMLREKKGNIITQIILRTGQAGKTIEDEHDIARKYEINDFIDKTDNSYSRIRSSLTTSIRMYLTLYELEYSRKSLDMMVSSLMTLMNLSHNKETGISTDRKLLVTNLFKYFNQYAGSGNARPADDAIDYLVRMENFNLFYILYLIRKTMDNTKSSVITEKDLVLNNPAQQLKWKDSRFGSIKKLHKLLCGYKGQGMQSSVALIDPGTKYQIFRDHHDRKIPEMHVRWLGDISDLLYLYHLLEQKDYLDPVKVKGDRSDELWSIIHNELPVHYLLKNEILNSDTLKTYKPKYRMSNRRTTADKKTIIEIEWVWDSPNKELIDQIINELENDNVVSFIENRAAGLSLLDWVGSDRATLAIIFTDVIGSTALSNEIGLEKMNEIRNAHFNQGRKLLSHCKGKEIKTMGDSFMVAFKSVDCALDFALAYHNNTGHPRIRIRSAIHVGISTVEDNDLFGTHIDFTARMSNTVKDAGICISDKAKKDIDVLAAERHNHLQWISRENVTFKGFEGEHRLWVLKQ